jgi:hypothetical protein
MKVIIDGSGKLGFSGFVTLLNSCISANKNIMVIFFGLGMIKI